MKGNRYRKLIGKIKIVGELECLTGLHIGASQENIEIGGLDSPVARDPMTFEPYIPGSSLKGKLRSLLEKAHSDLLPNRAGGSGTFRHECDDWFKSDSQNRSDRRQKSTYPGALYCPVCRLFGSTSGPGRKGRNFASRLKVRDLELVNGDQLKDVETGLRYTEWKFENTLDRATSASNPRNLERVPKGAKFALSLVYDVEDEKTLQQDLDNLGLAIRLLHDDYLGGHGSRGYGQVRIDFTGIEGRKLGYYRKRKGQTKKVRSIDEIDLLVDFFKKDGKAAYR